MIIEPVIEEQKPIMKQELIIEPKPIKQSVNKSLLKPNNNQTI